MSFGSSARWDHQDGARYFELEYETNRGSPSDSCSRGAGSGGGVALSDDADEARLVLVARGERQRAAHPRQAHKLVAYMAERSPALCTHAELMDAVWGDEPMHSRGAREDRLGASQGARAVRRRASDRERARPRLSAAHVPAQRRRRVRAVHARVRPRPRRDGHGLPRAARAPRAEGGAEGDRARPRRRPGLPRPVSARVQLAPSPDYRHVIPIYDADEIDTVLYLAMRYVDGPELQARSGRAAHCLGGHVANRRADRRRTGCLRHACWP